MTSWQGDEPPGVNPINLFLRHQNKLERFFLESLYE